MDTILSPLDVSDIRLFELKVKHFLVDQNDVKIDCSSMHPSLNIKRTSLIGGMVA